MGFTKPSNGDSRIADANAVWQAACDGDVIDWDKVNQFIVSLFFTTTKHGGSSGTLKIQWRNVTDGGTFQDLGTTGELVQGTATVLVNCNAVANPADCHTTVDSHEVEGAGTSKNMTIGKNEFGEIQFAIDPANALDGKEYAFQLYDVSQGSALGEAFATITLALGVTEKSFSDVGSGVDVFAKQIFEDFTTYEEYDPNGVWSKTASRVTGTAVRRDDTGYVVKDKGAGHFSGDFDHKMDMRCTGANSGGGSHIAFFYAVSMLKGDNNDMGNHISVSLLRNPSPDPAGKFRFLLRATGITQQLSGYRDIGTTYYLRIKRTGTTLTLDIYASASDRDNEQNALDNLQPPENAPGDSFRYIYGGQGLDSDNLPTLTISGYVENLALQEEAAPPTEKGFSDTGSGSDSFVNPFRAMGFGDVGAGAESFGTPFKAMGFSDVGLGSDVFQIVYRELSFSDAGSGADVFFLLQEKSFSDAGSGIDVFSLLVQVAFSDVGSGIDVFTKEELIGIIEKFFSDTGAGSDVFAIPFKILSFFDLGSGLDVFNIPFKALRFSEIGEGTDAFKGAVLIEPPTVIVTIDGKIILRISVPTKDKPIYMSLGG